MLTFKIKNDIRQLKKSQTKKNFLPFILFGVLSPREDKVTVWVNCF